MTSGLDAFGCLMETWSVACRWFSDRTSSSIVNPDSESLCSIHVSGKANAGPCPCKRRANSAINELTIGGFDRAMSAITRIRFFGSFSATSVILSAQLSARLRSIRSAASSAATRLRFSINASRSMMGMAHNSPSFKAVTPLSRRGSAWLYPLGKMSPGSPDLLFDQVEIVEQPFAGRRDAPVRFDGRGQKMAGFTQHLFVIR